MYTCGFSEMHPSARVEFIALDVPRADPKIAGIFRFLAERLLSGHEVCPNQIVQQSHGVKHMIIAVDDDLRHALLEDYACRCARYTNLLLVVRLDLIPFALPGNLVLHKWRKATTLLELALWRSQIVLANDQVDANADTKHLRQKHELSREDTSNLPAENNVELRQLCHAKSGADVIIPRVLSYLTGVEIGDKVKCTVGECELHIKVIESKMNLLQGPTPFLHQVVYNSFHLHPSGKSTMERGKRIRHFNGNNADNSPGNLAECTMYEALVHIDDWTSDWCCFLTQDEEKFVRDNIGTFRGLYKGK